MKNAKTVLALTLTVAVVVAVACTSHAAPGGPTTEQRLAALEAQMLEVQAELAALHTALAAANFTVVSQSRNVPVGSTVGISAQCPAGKTLRVWSYNITGYVGGVLITNDYPQPDLRGYFVRAEGVTAGGSGAGGGTVSVNAVCGPEILE
jgi:hypothetical protein